MKKMTLLAVVFLFTLSISGQTAIQEFDFNGTLSNRNKDVSFFGTATFVNDRAGIPNNAIRVTNSSIEATVIDLPSGNSSRTVTVWVKYNDITKVNNVWGYGSFHNARYFGLIQQIALDSKSDLYLAGCGEVNDMFVSTEVVPNIWYNYTVTYDGVTSKIFRNGELIKSSVSPRKLTSGIVFSIGKKGTSVSIDADIDDLKLYDVALSEEEVVSLYKGNSSLPGTNVAAGIVTSKTVDAIKSETVQVADLGTRSSEIYSIKGVKVFASNTNIIDIGSLVGGTYLLQITHSAQSLAGTKTKSNSSKIEEAKRVLTVPSSEGRIKSSEIYSRKGEKVFVGSTNIIDISSIPEGSYSIKITNS